MPIHSLDGSAFCRRHRYCAWPHSFTVPMPHLLFFSVISCPFQGDKPWRLLRQKLKSHHCSAGVVSRNAYVARQPILDLQGRVHGYDLLFRNTPETILRKDGEMAVETMLDNEVIFGLSGSQTACPHSSPALLRRWLRVGCWCWCPDLPFWGIRQPGAGSRPRGGLRTLRGRGFVSRSTISPGGSSSSAARAGRLRPSRLQALHKL